MEATKRNVLTPAQQYDGRKTPGINCIRRKTSKFPPLKKQRNNEEKIRKVQIIRSHKKKRRNVGTL